MMSRILARELYKEIEQVVDAIDSVLDADAEKPSDIPTDDELAAVITLGEILAAYHEKGSPGDGPQPAESQEAFLDWAKEKKPEIRSDPQYDSLILRLFFNSFPKQAVTYREKVQGYLAYELACKNGHIDKLLAAFEEGRFPVNTNHLNWRTQNDDDFSHKETIKSPWTHRLGIAVAALKLSNESVTNGDSSKSTKSKKSRKTDSTVSVNIGRDGIESPLDAIDIQDAPMGLSDAITFVIEAFDASSALPTDRELAAVLATGKKLAEHHKQSQGPEGPILAQGVEEIAEWIRQLEPLSRNSGQYCKFIMKLFFKCFEGQVCDVEKQETGFCAYKRACEDGTLQEHLAAFKDGKTPVSTDNLRWETNNAEWLKYDLRKYRLKIAVNRLDRIVRLVPAGSQLHSIYARCNGLASQLRYPAIKGQLLLERNLLAGILQKLSVGPSHVPVWFDSKFILQHGSEIGTFFKKANGKQLTPTDLRYLFCGIIWKEYQASHTESKKGKPLLKDAYEVAVKNGWAYNSNKFDDYTKPFTRAAYSYLRDAANDFYDRGMSLAELLSEADRLESNGSNPEPNTEQNP